MWEMDDIIESCMQHPLSLQTEASAVKEEYPRQCPANGHETSLRPVEMPSENPDHHPQLVLNSPLARHSPRSASPNPVGTSAKLPTQTVKTIENVSLFMEEMRSTGKIPAGSVLELTAMATGVSIGTVEKIRKIKDINVYKTPTKKKILRNKFEFDKIDEMTYDLLRRIIYRIYKRDEFPSTASIVRDLLQQNPFPYKQNTVSKLLKNMTFTFKKHRGQRSFAIEAFEVVAERYEYLHKIQRYRSMKYQDLYIGETWYDFNMCRFKHWTDNNFQIDGGDLEKGERLIFLHCGGREGFLKHGLFTIHNTLAEEVSNNYDDVLSATVFEEWFENLVRHLQGSSVIVMDRAPYHSRLSSPEPTHNWTTEKILEYMHANDIPVPDIPVKTILLATTRKHMAVKEKRYVVQDIAEKYGHMVIRLPPHHTVLNPIEMVWAELGSAAKTQGANLQSVDSIRTFVETTLNNVTDTKWTDYIKRVTDIEEEYIHLEHAFDRKFEDSLHKGSRKKK